MAYSGLDADQRGGTGPSGKESFTIEEAAARLTREGLSWSGGLGQGTSVTYAFRATAPAQMLEGTEGFERLNPQQIANVEAALALWSRVANISFVRVGAGASGEGAYSDAATMLFGGYSAGSDDATAFAVLPGNRAATSATGDVWLNQRDLDNVRAAAPHSYGFATLLHEIGHAIGLSHPAEYDAVSGGTFTYARDAGYHEDSEQYTLMSYFSAVDSGALLGVNGWVPGGPMIDDIAAVQRLYGANFRTDAGATAYGHLSGRTGGFLSGATPTTDKNLVAQYYGGPVFGTVWDGGGVDTLYFDQYGGTQSIDLRPGSFSEVGGTVGAFSIAAGVVIENAVGGSGADTLIGNAADNILVGGAGVDRAVIAAASAAAVFSVGAADVRFVATAQGRDELRGVEIVQFSDRELYVREMNGVDDVYRSFAGRGAVSGELFYWADRIAGGSDRSPLHAALLAEAAPRARTAGQVDDLYRGIFNRAPTTAELDYWMGAFERGALIGSLRAALLADPASGSGIPAAVNGLYREYLGRAAFPSELNYWSGEVRAGLGFAGVRAGLVNDASGRAHASAVVAALYAEHLGRAASASELDYWTGEVRAGLGFAGVRAGLVNDASGRAHTAAVVGGLYRDYGGRDAFAGEVAYWDGAVRGGASFGDVRAAILADPLGRAHAAAVIGGLYVEHLGRAAFASELDYWAGEVRGGLGFAGVRAGLVNDASGRAHTAAVVGELYRDYGGREAFASEIAYWDGEVRGGASFANVRGAILDDALGRVHTTTALSGLYRELFGRDPSGAEQQVWTGLFRAGADLDAARAALMTDGGSAGRVTQALGTAGADRFAFAASDRHLTVTGFDATADVLDLRGSGFQSYTAREVVEVDGRVDVLVTLDAAHDVLLRGVALAQLGAGDVLI